MSGAGRRIATSAALIMLGNVASRLLGLFREQTIAALFGTTVAASVFTAATRVPTMVYDLLIGGAISAALVPVFSEYAERDAQRPAGEGELGRLAGAVIGVTLAVLLPAVVLLMIFAEPVMGALGEGFPPEIQAQGVLLVRLALPSVLALGVSAVMMGVLYSLHRVALPSFATGIYNAGIIAGALALSPWLGVSSLVVGVLAGAAGHMIMQMFGLRGLRLTLSLDLRHPGVRRIVRLYLPVAAGLLVSAAVVAIDTRLASQTGEGSLAAMRYATTLVQLPLGLVATALSFASLPVLSRYGAGGASDPGFRRTLALGIKAALVLIVPATVALISLREPVVRLLFERGLFGADGVALTSLALLFYAPQLPFVAVDQLLIAAAYALQNTRLPVLVGVGCAGLYLAVALATVRPMGMSGLVLANTVQNSAHAVILLVLLWRSVGTLRSEGVWGSGLRVLCAGAGMAAAALAAQTVVPSPSGFALLVPYLLLIGGLSSAVYLGILAVWRGEELAFATSLLQRRLRPAPKGAA